MKRQRKAKILVTLGPSSPDEDAIRALYETGADVFRLNFSHGTHDEHRARYEAIRAIEQQVERPIAVLADLQGPKLRVGAMQGGAVELTEGARFRLDLDEALGDTRRAPLPHPEVFAALGRDVDLLLNDGRLRLRVRDCGPDFAETVVVTGGTLSDRKGVNVPGTVLPISPLTEKDRADLAFALGLGVDWVALSFVQRADDVVEARRIIGDRAAIMVKVEKPAAVRVLGDLIEQADALMVARGDLGVELPPEEVPGLQKRMISECRQAGKPVVVATQMLESMVNSPTPTRAEASDVATAVFDGADAVMLSAETASGRYPLETVAMMDRIITSAEQDPAHQRIVHALHATPEPTAAGAITAAAAQVAGTISAALIVTYTMSGSTALRAARERPAVPILLLTNRIQSARRFALLWGAHCVHTADVGTTQEMVDKACRIAVQEGFADLGDLLVITAGVPFGTPGTTNMLRIAQVEG